VTVRADDHLVQVAAQERLAAREGDIERRAAQAREDFIPLLDRHVVVGLRHTSQVRHFELQRKLTLTTIENGYMRGQPKRRKPQ